MKEENDLFDDAMQQKLGQAKMPPPAGVFEEVVSRNKKNRRYGWWLLLLLIPGWLILQDQRREMNRNSGTSDTVEDISRVDADAAANKENRKGQPGTLPPASTLAMTGNNEPNTAQNNGGITRSSTNEGVKNINHPPFNETWATAAVASGKSRSAVHKNGLGKHSKGKPTSPVKNEAGYPLAYGKLPTTAAETPFIMYPVTIIPAGEYRLPIQPTLHRPATGLQEQLMVPSRLSVEFSISTMFTYLNEKPDTGDTMSVRLIAEKNQHRVIQNGLQLEGVAFYTIGKRFSAGIGIGYSRFEEKLDFSFTEYFTGLDVDTIQYYILFPFTPPVLVTEYDSTLISLSRVHSVTQRVTVQSAVISTYIRYTLPAGRFTVEPQAGCHVTLFSQFKGTGNANPEFQTLENSDLYESRVEMALTGSIAACYSLSEKIGLFIRTGYTAGLTPLTGSPGFSTINRQQFSAGAGVRYNFSEKQAAKSTGNGSDLVNK